MKFRTLVLRGTIAALALSFVAVLVQARFPQPAAEYQGRRAKLRAEADGPVVLFGYTSRNDAGEVAVFFQDEDFYYLTGYSEPDAALVLIPDSAAAKTSGAPTEILYLPPRDPREAIWGGAHLGPNDPGVTEKTGFQAVRPFAELRGDLAALAKTNPKFYALLPKGPENGYPQLHTWHEWLKDALPPQSEIEDAQPTLTEMRMVKSAGELELLQKAVDASVDAQFAAMKMMKPGLMEYQVAAKMEGIHKWKDARAKRMRRSWVRGFSPPCCTTMRSIIRSRMGMWWCWTWPANMAATTRTLRVRCGEREITARQRRNLRHRAGRAECGDCGGEAWCIYVWRAG